ncbi:MAG: hypothetical protein BWY00_01279 [Firmicutes bacterium ADurb.Bin153]|nr:MAG: hypothetical protein BWY00_01279 [Firmicutes bacterium ADurb.Bin153]
MEIPYRSSEVWKGTMNMGKRAVHLFLATVVVLAVASSAFAADWKLTQASAAEYSKLTVPEKEIAEKWLATLPDKAYRESFRQLVMGLVLWSYKEPISFLDYEFVKLFETKGVKVDIYTFTAGDAKMALEIYSPPVIPGDL